MRLKEKVVVVTGASMGIGEAIARAFVAEGAHAVLSSRDVARVEAARQRVGPAERTVAVGCDVTRTEELQRLLAAALDRHGRVDVWVNNAGYGLIDAVEYMDMAECRRLFDTNVFGAVAAMQLVTPVMKKQGGGTIINISSIAGHIAVPNMAAYCASKHALNAFGKAARVELMGTGVHVMTVCPGYIATDFAVNAVKGKEQLRLSAAARPGISAERVARAVLRGYLGGKREIVVPWKDHLLIGAYRLAPRVMEYGMKRMLRPAAEVIAEAAAVRKG